MSPIRAKLPRHLLLEKPYQINGYFIWVHSQEEANRFSEEIDLRQQVRPQDELVSGLCAPDGSVTWKVYLLKNIFAITLSKLNISILKCGKKYKYG